MNTRKLARSILIATTVTALLSGTSHAAEKAKQESTAPSKHQTVGMVSGAAAGAIVGGPFGAAVGFIVGAIAGTGSHEIRKTAQHAKQLEQELSEVRVALARATEVQQEKERVASVAQQLRGDILFRTNSAELDANTFAKLSQLGTSLATHPNLSLEIDGYADPRGKSQANIELSQQRASAVRAALIVGGVAPDQVKVAAHGAELSTAVQGDMEAYAWERRVSLAIVSPTNSAQVAQAK
jgi:outer membrane protein OmpA-like peptidoglycan-associated protein